MSFNLSTFRRALPRAAASITVLAMLGLTACGTATPASTNEAPPTDLYGHIHAISIEESTQRVLLATHNGLFDASGTVPKKIGPTLDLMGFTVSPTGTFYASGHPGPGSDLPNPLGLMESTDSGETWVPLSLQGQSDFHALTANRDAIIGFDGKLRTTSDGKKWVDGGPMAPAPYALVSSPQSAVVLATTEEGLWRSADSGETWSAPSGGPKLLTAAFADSSTVLGVTPEGSVYLSNDAGLSWEALGPEVGPATTMGAIRTEEGTLLVWMDLERGVVKFSYDGKTLTEVAP